MISSSTIWLSSDIVYIEKARKCLILCLCFTSFKDNVLVDYHLLKMTF